jgi:hypothetical protein
VTWQDVIGISERFEATRLALNDISDRLFSIGDANFPIEHVLKIKDSGGVDEIKVGFSILPCF